jgi:hypothetical protein
VPFQCRLGGRRRGHDTTAAGYPRSGGRFMPVPASGPHLRATRETDFLKRFGVARHGPAMIKTRGVTPVTGAAAGRG